MIVRMPAVYKELSEELGLSVSIIESIGVEVLSSLREKLNAPSEIAYELPQLGTFTLKHTKYESFHKALLDAIAKGNCTVGKDYPEEMYNNNLVLINKIKWFREDKEKIKKLKDGRKEKTNKPS
jgi:hypothetical protein